MKHKYNIQQATKNNAYLKFCIKQKGERRRTFFNSEQLRILENGIVLRIFPIQLIALIYFSY
jgi:hypothetical protein